MRALVKAACTLPGRKNARWPRASLQFDVQPGNDRAKTQHRQRDEHDFQPADGSGLVRLAFDPLVPSAIGRWPAAVIMAELAVEAALFVDWVWVFHD